MDFRIDVLDISVEPARVRFETQTRTKMLGSAEALAKALYTRRYADGYPKDLVRVHHEGNVVFVYGLLDYQSRLNNSSAA